jgi:hypothetical protein
MHAAKHDRLSIRPIFYCLSELKGVAHKIGVLDHFVALIEMSQHHQPLTQRMFRRANAKIQFLLRSLPVLPRNHPLPRSIPR